MIVEKWREHNVDINTIKFKNNIIINSIISFPHASNEVTVCRGALNNKECELVFKVGRRVDENIEHEFNMLTKLRNEGVKVPKVFEYGKTKSGNSYIVIEYKEGKRLSVLHNECKYQPKDLIVFGSSLSKIHCLNITAPKVEKRKFHSKPETTDKYIIKVNKWLDLHEPKIKDEVFCHGDHHYANILLDEKMNTIVLDLELAGIGWKEFDLAWAMVLRPGQRFFKTSKEEQYFLEGYSRYNKYNKHSYEWCKVLVYSHFYIMGVEIKDLDYTNYLKAKINEIITK